MNKRTREQARASWIFGGIFILFLMFVFLFSPEELPLYKQRILAVVAGLTAGLFGYFLAGTISLSAKPQLPWLGETAVKSTGGIALFIIVLMWWFSEAAPIKVDVSPIDINMDVNLRVDDPTRALPASPTTAPGPPHRTTGPASFRNP